MQNSNPSLVFLIRFSIRHKTHPNSLALHFYKIENPLNRRVLVILHIMIIVSF